jgi:hypothetical protein
LVRLLTDRYEDRGVSTGAIGVILDVYADDAYEVEFSREDGTTIAWFAVQQAEVAPYTERGKTPAISAERAYDPPTTGGEPRLRARP